jgi:hypothetical protein
MHAMVAQHVTNILAKETLDALSKFLNAIDICCRIRQVPSGASGGRGLNFGSSSLPENSTIRQ